MLHAVQKQKTRFHHRYLGERDGVEHRVHEEDEITSTVLGPIDFLEPSAAYKFWRRVLAAVGKENFFPTTPPNNASLELWKRRPASDMSGTIEPDAIVTMKWPNLPVYTLLIELKWRAGLSPVPSSGENQLSRQWVNYLRDDERATALHLFIAPDISKGASAYDQDTWQDKMVLLPWLVIRSVLGELASEPSGLGRWAEVADAFLGRVNIRRFGGFMHLFAESAPNIQSNKDAAMFWMTRPFWGRIGHIPEIHSLDEGPIFFNQ